ncbi:MAG TPA: 2-phosphosulfolactate phosphatase [Dongiaceae bacterium]|nr:2-phosphosulfolactate phosphatase [Dongiaceae bacterium]
MKNLEVLLAPAEFEAFARRDMQGTACVVFDILRATSTIVTALAHGAAAAVPVLQIAEALDWRRRQPGVLLAGERNGLRIRGEHHPADDFDLGNSPREFTAAVVSGKTIVTTTTNGTRALRACSGASRTLIGSFLNLAATARELQRQPAEEYLLVCSGTQESAAFEDTLAAGALCDLLLNSVSNLFPSDSAVMARELYLRFQYDLVAAMQHSANARRLLALPELQADVPYCLRRNTFDFSAEMQADGAIRKTAS